MNGNVLLIDLSSIFWSCYHSSANDVVSAARDRTLAQIRKLANGADHVAICCDSGRSFRHDLYADYKAQRPAKDPAAIGELKTTQERLVADGYLLWTCEGLEADDILATATLRAVNRGLTVTIATADKDLLQLVSGDTVTVLSTMTGERRNEEAVIAKYGIPPSMFRDFLALVGDTADNVPGVDKVGAKSAANLLRKYGPIEKIYEAACSNVADLEFLTPVIRGNIVNGATKLGISRQLVTLRDDAPIDFEAIFKRREQAPLETRDYSMKDTQQINDAEEANPEVPPPSEEVMVGEKPAKGASVALVAVSFDQELEPRNVNQAWTLARGLYNSRLYTKFPNPESIWAIIIRGRELGLGAGASLDNFHIIEGRPSPYSWLLIARAKQHPDCEYFQCVETTAESCTWETKNKNNPRVTTLTYTFAEAQVAQLPKPGNGWTKNRADMLRKSCGVKLCRMEYPDAAGGLYCAPEMGYDE